MNPPRPSLRALGSYLYRNGVSVLRSALIGMILCCGFALPSSAAQEGGTVSGRVFDAATGQAIANVTVVLDFPETDSDEPPPQFVAQSGVEGDYEFDTVPGGFYGLSFIKSGYRASVIANFEVKAGQDNVADFPLPRVEVTASGDVLELEAFTVEASVVGELLNNLELRLESDQLVNLLSAEDLSKFAASDVADALKRVAGVNIVEGQFAIIRGLEDRYSSTLYNGAPIPSPDPDSQSVQLDLFPSDIVSNLNIGKSFAPSTPSNSAGGSINIVTHEYPEEPTLKLSFGTGFNERTLDEFQRFDRGSPIGINVDGDQTIESDFSAMIGGTKEWWNRSFRFKAVAAREIDYETRIGKQGISQPLRFRGIELGGVIRRVFQEGGLSQGLLERRGPVFRLQESAQQSQQTYYVGAGVDLDEDGAHRIDGSYFFTRKEDETVQLRDNAVIPGFDYANLDEDSASNQQFSVVNFADHWIFDWFDPAEARGGVASGKHAYFSPVYESRTFDRSRDLSVYQLNGDHDLESILPGLTASWAANYAVTKQGDTTFNARYSFNTFDNLIQGDAGATAPGPLPANPADFAGTGLFLSRSDVVYSQIDIEENQYFGRFDLEYEFEPASFVEGVARMGYWFEQANRRVESRFVIQPAGDPRQPGVITRDSLGNLGTNGSLYDPSLPSDLSGSSPPNAEHTVAGFDAVSMGRRIFDGARIADELGIAPQTSRNKREISAWNGEIKLTFWEDFDVLAGLRIESLRIEVVNNPYLGTCDGNPNIELVNGSCPLATQQIDIFPFKSLFLDRRDNPASPDFADANRISRGFNDQILGIPTPADPYFDCFTRECLDGRLRGEINETFFLPAVSAAYRPIDGWIFRFAYSQTVARPSFREMGYYASQESGSDDFFVGNPQLTYSEVESFDGRVEWTFGDFGDLLAASVFFKTIERPIEQVVLIDEDNVDCTGVCVFRTYLNNASDANLLGVELEGRRTLDFIGGDWMGGQSLEVFSVGGNFTYIDAEVKRSPVRIDRSANFFGVFPGDPAAFSGYSGKRRLFGQPEWIANADISFDHPDWGSKATLSIFAISEVLDTVGSSQLSNTLGVTGFELDRYIDAFYQLDLVMSQAFSVPRMPGEFTARASVKNLTDTTRKVIYDQSQTVDDVRERSFKVGRDYSFAIGYELNF